MARDPRDRGPHHLLYASLPLILLLAVILFFEITGWRAFHL